MKWQDVRDWLFILGLFGLIALIFGGVLYGIPALLRYDYLQKNPMCERYFDEGYDSLDNCWEIKETIDNGCAGYKIESYLIQKYNYLGC